MPPNFRIAVLASPDGWHIRDLMRAAGQLKGIEIIPTDFCRLSAALETNLLDTSLKADLVFARAMPAGSLEQVVFRMDVLLAASMAGMPVVNPPRAIETAVDKYLCLARLQNAGLPVPRTRVSQTADQAIEHFDQLGGHTVAKPIFGSLGHGLRRLTNPQSATEYFRDCEKERRVIYQQEMIDHGGRDLRCLVIGGKVFAMQRKALDGHWITNVSQGGTAMAYAANEVERQLALNACRSIGATIAGVDLAYSANESVPSILEVNSSPGWRAIAGTLEVDIAQEILLLLRSKVAM